MNTKLLLKLGACALLAGGSVVGCASVERPRSASASTPKAEKQAAKFAANAAAAIKARKGDKAVAAAEKAVALSPRNAEYRATLGEAYIQAGRFTSAAVALGEALTVDPAHGRARFQLALVQTALGNWEIARATLAQIEGSQADVGLALALAGDHEGGIAKLEQAARAEDAGVKARQNLALAYALAGRWNEARAAAERDVPADQVPARLSQWAKFARPESSWDQVASLLGVTPVEDPGRPAALALAAAAPTAVAEAAPASSEPVAVAEAAVAPADPPVETAAVQPVEVAASTAAVEMASAEPAAAAPDPSYMVSPAAATAESEAPLILADPAPVRVAAQSEPAAAPRSGGKWVLQLGAFSVPQRVDVAWKKAVGRYGGMSGYSPVGGSFAPNGRTVHRLAVSGFQTRAEAVRMCARVKARGGDCFVRAANGEQALNIWRSSRTQFAAR